jgi:hypothetical protein
MMNRVLASQAGLCAMELVDSLVISNKILLCANGI